MKKYLKKLKIFVLRNRVYFRELKYQLLSYNSKVVSSSLTTATTNTNAFSLKLGAFFLEKNQTNKSQKNRSLKKQDVHSYIILRGNSV